MLPDFCLGNSQQSGPAGTVMNILEERGITSNDVIFTAFTYYQSVRLRTCSCVCIHQHSRLSIQLFVDVQSPELRNGRPHHSAVQI